MGATGGILATFARSLHDEELDGSAVASLLCHALHAQRQDAGMVDLWWYGISVEMELYGEHWAVECVGPNAFRLYPGVVREESVTWLNLWVVADYKLEELIERMNEVAAAAKERRMTLARRPRLVEDADLVMHS